MIKESQIVNLTENPQNELSRLYPEWKQLRLERKFYEADQLKQRINILKRRIKHLPK